MHRNPASLGWWEEKGHRGPWGTSCSKASDRIQTLRGKPVAPLALPRRRRSGRRSQPLPDPEHRFVPGIGTAITDASAGSCQASRKGSAHPTEGLLEPHEGNGRCRTSIHSCDFSSASYTYCDEDDEELKSFSIAPDLAIEFLIRAAREASGGQLQLLASPWSAPGWMKDTGTMLEGGRLRPEHRGTWARTSRACSVDA